MIKIIKLVFFCSSILILICCKESYDPPAIANAPSFLVVEGFINTNGATRIRLSRSAQLKDTSKVLPETRAVLQVEDEQNTVYSFFEQSEGNYILPASGFSSDKKYRLRIRTSSSTEYLSDYIEAIQTPQIDSINFKVQNDGVQFYVNTHDGQNKTRYYKWEYDETWEYRAFHNSITQYVNSGLEFRPISNSIYACWKSGVSNSIILGSSDNLSSDVIEALPVNFVTAASGKLSFGYNILVRQNALTEEAFQYWQNLKKNTEQLGSIFDSQPSIASGNIHCVTNPDEPVIGFLSASSVTTKRFHFENSKLPLHSPSYLPPPTAEACQFQNIMVNPATTFPGRVIEIFSSGRYIPVNPISVPGQGIIGYMYAIKECVDCREKGGTNVKPSFWPF